MATFLNYSPLQLSGRHGVGPFQLSLEEDGGVIRQVEVKVGYGRRHIEKISSQMAFVQVVNYSDRVDFNSAPAYNYITSTAFEQLLNLEIPERAQYIRTLLLELSRISNHLLYFSKIAKSVEQLSLMNQCLREWERFCDIFEMYCGSRLAFGSICIGGVREDASDGWFFRIEKALNSVREFLPDIKSSLLNHPFFKERTRGLAVISREEAIRWNLSGPNARASGVDRDLRIEAGFAAYPKIYSNPSIGAERDGDVWSRVGYRMFEISQSMDFVLALFRKIPNGNFRIRIGAEVESEPGFVFHRVESARGEVSLFVDCAGGQSPAMVKYFCPSNMLISLLPSMLRGIRTEDVFLAIQSLDISFSEVDR